MAVQHRMMVPPLGRIAQDVRGELGASPADDVAGIQTKRPNMVGQIRETMLLVGLPKPIRRGQGKIAKPRLAFATRSIGALERAGVGHERPKQEREADQCAKGTDGYEDRLAAPVG